MTTSTELGALVSNPRVIANLVKGRMENLRQETLRCVLLDTNNRLMNDQLVSTGTIDASVVLPRDVFRPAIAENAASIILLHNHPGGDPTPSPNDIEVTRKLTIAGDILGIKVIDHIIIGNCCWISLKQEGLL